MTSGFYSARQSFTPTDAAATMHVLNQRSQDCPELICFLSRGKKFGVVGENIQKPPNWSVRVSSFRKFMLTRGRQSNSESSSSIRSVTQKSVSLPTSAWTGSSQLELFHGYVTPTRFISPALAISLLYLLDMGGRPIRCGLTPLDFPLYSNGTFLPICIRKKLMFWTSDSTITNPGTAFSATLSST